MQQVLPVDKSECYYSAPPPCPNLYYPAPRLSPNVLSCRTLSLSIFFLGGGGTNAESGPSGAVSACFLQSVVSSPLTGRAGQNLKSWDVLSPSTLKENVLVWIFLAVVTASLTPVDPLISGTVLCTPPCPKSRSRPHPMPPNPTPDTQSPRVQERPSQHRAFAHADRPPWRSR